MNFKLAGFAHGFPQDDMTIRDNQGLLIDGNPISLYLMVEMCLQG